MTIVAGRYFPFFTAVALLFAFSAQTFGDGFLGADRVLSQVATEAEDGAHADPGADLKQRLGAYQRKSSSLSPEEAAVQWLQLFDAHTVYVGDRSSPSSERLSGQDLLATLPPPAAWDALKAAVEARPAATKRNAVREVGLRMIVAALTRDEAAFLEHFRSLQKISGDSSNPEQYFLDGFFMRLSSSLNGANISPEIAEAVLKHQMASYARQRGGGFSFGLPDLETIFGEERAKELARQALLMPNVSVHAQGKNTRKLLSKLALEMIDELKSPPWRLACTLDSATLYEALERRFPNDPGAQSHDPAQVARGFYILALVARGESEKALKHARPVNPTNLFFQESAIKTLMDQGKGEQLFELFDQLLAASKESSGSLWEEYNRVAVPLGRTDKMLQRIKAMLANPDLTDEERFELTEKQISALLATDQIEEAKGRFRQVLSSALPADPSGSSSLVIERMQLAMRFARLGFLLEDKALADDAIRFVRNTLSQSPLNIGNSSHVLQSFVHVLYQNGQKAEAEKQLAENLVSAIRAQRAESKLYGTGSSYLSSSALMDLIAFYHAVDRHNDILTLLDQSPDWKDGDLAAFYTENISSFTSARSNAPVGFLVATALAATGKQEAARQIVDALLIDEKGFDPTYELLLKITSPEAALAKLDALAKADPFQERPLIWKAKLLLESQRLPEAEETIRKAIAVDPSDGEQGPNDRMRAYAVLADILHARGNEKDAALYKNVVRAIRLSEKADQFLQVGLVSRAVALYRESLDYFADAYCIQSRLARQLFEQGEAEEAERHYRRAYELMPESFGRVESHCFGCEQAFDGEQYQNIAEKVFAGITLKEPNNAYAFYLLGYLRDEQGRYAEAVENYRVAVKLDPDYLNAWRRLQSAVAHIDLSDDERDAIAIRLFELSPKTPSTRAYELRNVKDLRKLWEVVASALPLPEVPETLYPLAAAKNKIAGDSRPSVVNFQQERELTPSGAVASQELISTISFLLDN